MDNNNPDPWAAYRRPPADDAAATLGTPDAAETSGQQTASATPQPVPEISAPVTPPLFPYAQLEEIPPQPAAPPPPPRRRDWFRPLLAGFAGALGLAAILWVAGVFDDPPPTIAAAAPVEIRDVREIVTAENQTSATAVALKVVPSIVTVDVGSDFNGTFDRFASGSGVVLTGDGLIATNQHVVADAERVQVIFSNGRMYEADVVGSDQRTDLAVLRIDATGLVPIEIGSTDDAEIGQIAIALGSPLGLEGGPSLTVGVVSAFGRRVSTGPGDNEILFDMIQTDAPITQGSSGGALVDEEGRLLGITSAIGVSSAGAEGIGFAIPAELVTRITNEIIETGAVEHAFLGVTLGVAFDEAADGAQIPAGALVSDFPTNPSAAQIAGIQTGDLIVAYNGSEVATQEDLISGLRRLRVGDTVTLEVVRGTEVLEIDVVLRTRPEDM